MLLCGAVLVGANAQKANVDQAKKLIGKKEKIDEARSLIQQAIQNPETSEQALTYYTAGKIEWDAYDKDALIKMASPDKVNPIEMGNELLNGYNYYIQVFPLDQLPNEKGEVKPKYTKELQKKIAEKQANFWDAGAVFYQEKMGYPQAYNAFMIYAGMPDLEELGQHRPVETPDTMRALAYYYAGLSAWSDNKVDEAAKAFGLARAHNFTEPEAYIYEIAAWQNIAQNDTAREKEAQEAILVASKAGFDKFGMIQPVFINNIANTLINTGRENEALDIANQAIEDNPDVAALYGLRAYIYDRMNNEEASEADYRKAAEMPDVDFPTMENVVKKLLRVGQERWNDIELGDPDIVAKKNYVRTNYFEAAKKYAEKAKTLTDQDTSDMDYLIESIDYQLSL